MDKSYRFHVPKNTTPEPKRTRRRFIQFKASEEPNQFNYRCYQCDTPYTTALSANAEIECPSCSSRIIRKESSKKPHVLEAI